MKCAEARRPERIRAPTAAKNAVPPASKPERTVIFASTH